MSTVRRKPTHPSRTALSSPYARPLKKSSWSFSSFLNFLNPLRSRESTEEDFPSLDEPDLDMRDEVVEELIPPSPAHKLSRRGQQLSENISANGRAVPGPPPPPKSSQLQSSLSAPPTGLPSVDFTFQASSSASQNLDRVTRFLTSHANQPIAPEDINQMVALIQQSKPGVSPSPTVSENHVYDYDIEEPFRFETRAATSPPRSKSPSILPRGSSAPRTLSRNPNGSYTWKGAGSARAHRSRNNYSSPAFRTPRAIVTRQSTSSTEGSGNDAKRRRVGDIATEPQASSGQNQVAFPVTSSSTSRTTTSSSLKPPPVATPVRQRTPGLQKPTAPVVPSPLRQAWTGGSPSGSESGSPQGPSTIKQTETARHVTELVNSLKSQDKVLEELRNPYEIANPVKRLAVPKRKRVAAPAKKPAVVKPSREEDTTKVKIKEMSAHDIIEATLPEGSKRSRPPPELEMSPTATKEPLEITVEEEEIEEPRTSKRPKSQPNGHADKTAADVEMQAPQISAKDKKEKLPPIKVPPIPASSSQPSSSTKSLFGPKSSMPKEPSKLRFSVQPEPGSTPPSPVPEPKAEIDEAPKPILSGFTFNLAPAPAVPAPIAEKKETAPPTNLFPAFAPQPTPVPLPTASPPTAPPKNAKDVAKSHPVPSLPTFTFTFLVPSASGESRARDKAKTMSKTSLPTFDLAKSVVPPPSSMGSFNWSAAGVKPPAAPTSGEWTCDVCMLKNPVSATTKCTICDAPKPDSALPKPAVSLDLAAAGMKPVNGPSEGEWTCSTCSLRNPATATEKCTICDALKPGAVTEAPKPAPFFNWAAAGMKPAPGPTDGEWVCNVCLLKNPATATGKCGICDAPKPGALAASTPKTNGFDWAAAGMKAPIPASAGEWNCGLCGLKNPANATAKCNICDAPRS